LDLTHLDFKATWPNVSAVYSLGNLSLKLSSSDLKEVAAKLQLSKAGKKQEILLRICDWANHNENKTLTPVPTLAATPAPALTTPTPASVITATRRVLEEESDSDSDESNELEIPLVSTTSNSEVAYSDYLVKSLELDENLVKTIFPPDRAKFFKDPIAKEIKKEILEQYPRFAQIPKAPPPTPKSLPFKKKSTQTRDNELFKIQKELLQSLSPLTGLAVRINELVDQDVKSEFLDYIRETIMLITCAQSTVSNLRTDNIVRDQGGQPMVKLLHKRPIDSIPLMGEDFIDDAKRAKKFSEALQPPKYSNTSKSFKFAGKPYKPQPFLQKGRPHYQGYKQGNYRNITQVPQKFPNKQ
jgi:hypothetical protein